MQALHCGTKPAEGTTKNKELYGRNQEKSRYQENTVSWKWIRQGHEITKSVRCYQQSKDGGGQEAFSMGHLSNSCPQNT